MKGCDCPATLLVKTWRNKQCTNGILLNNCWETNCLSRFSSSEFLTFCKALREMREEARRLIFCVKVTWSGYKSSHWRLSWLVKCIFNSKWSHCLLGRRYRDLSVLEDNSSAVWIVPWLWGVLSGSIKQTLCFYSYLQFKSTFHTQWRRGSQWEIFHNIVNRLRSDGCCSNSLSQQACVSASRVATWFLQPQETPSWTTRCWSGKRPVCSRCLRPSCCVNGPTWRESTKSLWVKVHQRVFSPLCLHYLLFHHPPLFYIY